MAIGFVSATRQSICLISFYVVLFKIIMFFYFLFLFFFVHHQHEQMPKTYWSI